MTTTRSRFAPKQPAAAPSGAAPAGPTLGDALADNHPAVLRIRYRRYANGRGYHDLSAYSADGRLIWLDRDDDTDKLRRTAAIAYVRATFPDVDWTRDHDVHLDDWRVYSTPLAEEDGYLPDVDGTFGGGPAVYLAAAPAPPTDAAEPAFPFPPVTTGAAA